LSELRVGNDLDHNRIRALLDVMRAQTKPVKPKLLGVIGRSQFSARFQELGCLMDSFKYRAVLVEDKEGLPNVLETAFGWYGEGDRRKRCAVKLVPPENVLLERAHAMLAELPRNAACLKLAELVDVDGSARELCEQLIGSVTIDDTQKTLMGWAGKLEPKSWDKFLEEQLIKRVEAINKELHEKALAAIRTTTKQLWPTG
jgi:hypothetical protein